VVSYAAVVLHGPGERVEPGGGVGSGAIEARAAGLGGLSETEHLICRTAESHDSTGLVVSGSANDMSTRWKQCPNDHLELLRCHYNFVRSHPGAEIRREVRTPARQAGLTKRALTLRKMFSSRELFVASKNVLFALFESVGPVTFPIRECVWRPSNN
jgi:hypothetical protein